eukprot:scaffold389_cov211-Alexandrium_tamarense.AAC.10
MKGDHPFVIQLNIVCGGGSQVVSEVVKVWIRDSKQIANGPKGSVVKTALSASTQPEALKTLSTIAAGAVPAIFTSSAALATEGTNEWFGVDDIRVLAVLFIGHYFILSLWLGQYGNATEDDDADFFGEIDYTGSCVRTGYHQEDLTVASDDFSLSHNLPQIGRLSLRASLSWTYVFILQKRMLSLRRSEIQSSDTDLHLTLPNSVAVRMCRWCEA